MLVLALLAALGNIPPESLSVAAHGGLSFAPGSGLQQGYGFDVALRYHPTDVLGVELLRLGWVGFDSLTRVADDGREHNVASQQIHLGIGGRIRAPKAWRQSILGVSPWFAAGPTLQIAFDGSGTVLDTDARLRAESTPRETHVGVAMDVAVGMDWPVGEGVSVAAEARLGMPVSDEATWVGFIGAFVSVQLGG